jgi:hypothetical protein
MPERPPRIFTSRQFDNLHKQCREEHRTHHGHAIEVQEMLQHANKIPSGGRTKFRSQHSLCRMQFNGNKQHDVVPMYNSMVSGLLATIHGLLIYRLFQQKTRVMMDPVCNRRKEINGKGSQISSSQQSPSPSDHRSQAASPCHTVVPALMQFFTFQQQIRTRKLGPCH